MVIIAEEIPANTAGTAFNAMCFQAKLKCQQKRFVGWRKLMSF
jgi:hypothetical protein